MVWQNKVFFLSEFNLPAENRAIKFSKQVGCHDMLTKFFVFGDGAGETCRFTKCGSPSESTPQPPDQYMSYKYTKGESRCSVDRTLGRVWHQDS
jgi:hypothetical protein